MKPEKDRLDKPAHSPTLDQDYNILMMIKTPNQWLLHPGKIAFLPQKEHYASSSLI